MIAQRRHDLIVERVERQGTATVPELAEQLGISESTIRRDLNELDSAGRLVKVHGGATASASDERVLRDLTLPERYNLNAEQKMAIAHHAAQLIGPEDFVYIDAGSTTADLIGCITETRACYVTNSVSHALKLVAKGCQAIVVGGELKGVTEALVGPDAVDVLSRYHFSVGFWGTNGITEEQGLTTPDRSEALVKRVSIEHTNPARRYVLADASKFGRVAPVTFSALTSVHVLTESVPDAYKSFSNIQAIR